MIEVRYTDSDEIDISGWVPELQELRRAVLEVAKSGTRLEIEADQSVDPQPYDRTLSKIVIGLEANPTNVLSVTAPFGSTVRRTARKRLHRFSIFSPTLKQVTTRITNTTPATSGSRRLQCRWSLP